MVPLTALLQIYLRTAAVALARQHLTLIDIDIGQKATSTHTANWVYELHCIICWFLCFFFGFTCVEMYVNDGLDDQV